MIDLVLAKLHSELDTIHYIKFKVELSAPTYHQPNDRHVEISFSLPDTDKVSAAFISYSYFEALKGCLKEIRRSNRSILNEQENNYKYKVLLSAWQIESREDLHMALDETLKYADELIYSYREVEID